MNMVGLPPGMIITSSGDTVDLEALVQVGGDRLAQRQDAVRRRVAVMAVAQRLDGGLDDVLGRAEVGLADAEIDDVAALARRARSRAPAPRRRSPRRCGRSSRRFSAWRFSPFALTLSREHFSRNCSVEVKPIDICVDAAQVTGLRDVRR